MPLINKQTLKGKPIAPAKTTVRAPVPEGLGIKLNIYGRGKSGKTRLACNFPKKLLLIGTEDGTKSIATKKVKVKTLSSGRVVYALHTYNKQSGQDEAMGIDFCYIKSSDDIDELSKELGYTTYVVDTAGGVQDILLKEILGLDETLVQKNWGLADQQTWGIVAMQFKERMRCLLDLADTHQKNVVVIAHERNFKDDNKDSEISVPTVGSALTPTAANWLNGACDYVTQTFLRNETVERVRKINDEGGTMKTQVLTGKVEYCLRIGSHPVYMTGFRLVEGFEMPDVIVSPSYAKIVDIIEGKHKKPIPIVKAAAKKPTK